MQHVSLAIVFFGVTGAGFVLLVAIGKLLGGWVLLFSSSAVMDCNPEGAGPMPREPSSRLKASSTQEGQEKGQPFRSSRQRKRSKSPGSQETRWCHGPTW
jgi:hypothetical protein